VGAVRARRQSPGAGRYTSGIDRLHPQQEWRAELRHLGRCHAAPSVHGDVSQDDRRKGAARALPRQRGCAHRRDRRPSGDDDRRSGGRNAGHQRGQGEGVRAHIDDAHQSMPDLPTMAEAGVPGYSARPWFSVVAPAGTPRPIIDKLNGLLMAFINRPETQEKMNGLAITPWTSKPDEHARFIPAEIDKWAQVVKHAGITPD